AGPDRRARRTGASAAGALLAPRLGRPTADLAAGLGRRGALAAGVELGAHRLVDEAAVETHAEHGVVELGLRRLAEDLRVSHRCAPRRSSCAVPGPSRGRAAGSAWGRPARRSGRAG